jgi:hypothetical protein
LNREDGNTGRTLKLYSISGKLVISQKIQSMQTSLNVSNLPSGIYIMKIEGKKDNFVYKLIKQSSGSGK